MVTDGNDLFLISFDHFIDWEPGNNLLLYAHFFQEVDSYSIYFCLSWPSLLFVLDVLTHVNKGICNRSFFDQVVE